MPNTLSQETCLELVKTAKALVDAGKGILAADESTGTIQKRFDAIGVQNTEANRAFYRELLFTTPNINQYISGVILYEETLYQKNESGKKLVDILHEQNLIPGIKVDKGVVSLMGTDDEKATTGLDGLGKRCAEYYAAGARFAKWRAVLSIDPAKQKPSNLSILETAHTLARYASICQENKLVPIVEPEVLSDGTWSIQTGAEQTEKVLSAVVKALHDHQVLLEGCLLKPNMVTAGNECKDKPSPSEVAIYTVRTLKRTIPSALPGIVFLSGGQSEETASLNLNAINQHTDSPWSLSFSYGRALQSSTMKVWSGNNGNKEAAQKALLHRAKANSEAQLGKYGGGVGGSAAQGSLFEKKYVY